MHILALETSTLRAALAAERPDGARSALATAPGQRHGRELLPAVREVLKSLEILAKNLDVVAVGLGPGSYTGLRVGVTAAKILCYATRAQLVGLDSLEFFARSAPRSVGRLVVISDAQRGDFHVADFDRPSEDAPLSRTSPTRTMAAADLAASWTSPVVVTGPGVSRWPGPWPDSVQLAPNDAPDPLILLEMTREVFATGQFRDLADLEPIYLRASAAEDLWKQRRAPLPSH